MYKNNIPIFNPPNFLFKVLYLNKSKKLKKEYKNV